MKDEFEDLLPEEMDEGDQHLMHDLRHLYSARSNADKSLDYARQQLFQYADLDTRSTRGTFSQPERTTSLPRNRKRYVENKTVSRLGTIAAVLVVGLLVGTFVMIRASVHHGTTVSVPIATPTHQYLGVTDLYMTSNTTGWVLGEGVPDPFLVLRTTDGAMNWQDVSPQGEEHSYYSPGKVAFFGTSTMWMAQDVMATPTSQQGPATIFHTTNGGNTWHKTTIQTHSYSINSLTFNNAQEGWLLTEFEPLLLKNVPQPASLLELFHTTDGGTTWSRLPDTSFTSDPLFKEIGGTAVTFVNATTGWLTGSVHLKSRFFSTHDGGHTWQPQQLPVPAGSQAIPDGLNLPQFFTPDDGILTGYYNNSSVIATYVTHNGGKSWESSALSSLPQAVSASSDSLFPTPTATSSNSGKRDFFGFIADSCVFHDVTHGEVQFLDNDYIRLYATNDGGQHWTQLSSFQFPLISVYSLHFITTNTGWLLSDDTIPGNVPGKRPETRTSIYETTDGGRTWTKIHTHFPDYISPPSGY